MNRLDLRETALDLLGNPGVPKTLRMVFTANGNPVEPGPVSLWVGGDEHTPADLTTAVEYPAVLDGEVATVTFPFPTARTLVRLTIDGALATLGFTDVALSGRTSNHDDLDITLGAVNLHIDLAAMPVNVPARLAEIEERLTLLETISIVHTKHLNDPQEVSG